MGRYAYPEDLGKEQVVYHNDLDEEVNRHIRRLYAADVKLTDRGVEYLLKNVHHRVSDNLITVFTADHGESLRGT